MTRHGTKRADLQPWIRRLAFTHAATRAVLGGVLLFAPRLSARPWLGEAVEHGGGRVAMQAFAVRDLALGVGMLRGLARDEPVRHWFRLGLAFEIVDSGATVLNRRELPDGPIPDAMAVLGAFGLAGGLLVGALLDER